MSNTSIRTLFLTIMSYPPIGGAPLRNWQNINLMRKYGSVGVFTVFNQEQTISEVEHVELWYHYNIMGQKSPKILLEKFVHQLSHWGLSFCWVYLSHAAEQLETIMIEFKPDVVIFEELWLYDYLSVVKRHPCLIIFDDHNIELDVYQDTKCSNNSLSAWARSKLHLPQIQATEQNLIDTSDQIWVCSQEDKILLQKLYGNKNNIFVVPNGIDVRSYDPVRLGQCLPAPGLEDKQYNFIFPGNFIYPPNAEAAKVLIDSIYPRLRQVYPDCRLLLVGRGATGFMKAAADQNPNIIVTGEVPEIRPYLAAASVMVVPLYKGGGTRFKILEAFAAGCPVVSTSKGAEGLNSEDGVHLLIADDVESMTEAIAKLWSDNSLKTELVHNAYNLVQSKYSWEAVAENIKFAITDLNKKSSLQKDED